ncbi:predicted protein [Streptomyces albidoflavus]|nr:predicted protein [Streptomyces albidoflavus]
MRRHAPRRGGGAGHSVDRVPRPFRLFALLAFSFACVRAGGRARVRRRRAFPFSSGPGRWNPLRHAIHRVMVCLAPPSSLSVIRVSPRPCFDLSPARREHRGHT